MTSVFELIQDGTIGSGNLHRIQSGQNAAETASARIEILLYHGWNGGGIEMTNENRLSQDG